MNKQYESVVIISASLEDEQVELTLTRIENFLNTNGGEIIDIEKWGRKRLAYPISKSKSGYYLILRYQAPADLIKKFERMLRLDEAVIRYLTIQLDKKAILHYNKLRKELAEKPLESESVEPKVKVEETTDVKDNK